MNGQDTNLILGLIIRAHFSSWNSWKNSSELSWAYETQRNHLNSTYLSLWKSKELKNQSEPNWFELNYETQGSSVHKDTFKVSWFELMKLKGTQENSSELIWAYYTQWNAHRARKGKNLSKRGEEVTGFVPCYTFLGPIDSLIVFSVFPSWAIVKLRYKGYFDCSFLEDKGF